MSFLKSNKILLAIFIIVLIAFSTYSYVYKPHKNIEFTAVSFTGAAIEFEKSVHKNVANWLDKTVVINGMVTEIYKNGITLNNTVYCQFNTPLNNQKLIQTKITIKGRVIGYDDLLEEVKLDQCRLQK